jgi:1-acyl-sn-glycerol-3-phosphate acyltransferase
MEPRQLTWRWRVIATIVIVLVRVLRWRIDVQGLEHVPRRGGAVLAFNHHSYLDFLMVGWPVVRQLGRPLRFLAKREIWSSRKVGWAARWVEAVPVDRASAEARSTAFDAAAEALRAGDLVAVAPEQTISASFELLPLRAGAVRMAQLADVPVVPVAGWGTQRVLTKGGPKQLRTRLPVTIRFGPPLRVEPDADPVAATDQLAERMAALLDEVQRTYPDGAPAGAPWVPARLGGGAPEHAEVLRQHRDRERAWEPGDGRTTGPGDGRTSGPHSGTGGGADGRTGAADGGRDDADGG